MKSYTDLKQSKVLSKILPLESADYCWGIDEQTLRYNNSPYPYPWKDYTAKQYYVPCWSLSALLDVLIYPHIEQNCMGQWVCRVEQQNTTYLWEGSNPVDSCYEMVLKLHERNLL